MKPRYGRELGKPPQAKILVISHRAEDLRQDREALIVTINSPTKRNTFDTGSISTEASGVAQLQLPPIQIFQVLLVSQMADAPRGGAGRGGFGSRGDRGGDRGRGRGGRRGPRRGGAKSEEKEWQPVTKLGRLVKAGKITSMEQIYLHSLPIKEYQIVDWFLPKLKDEVMKVRYR